MSINSLSENVLADSKQEISVVIPCLNEERTIEGCIIEAADALKRAGISGEIIVADNGSEDGSVEIATKCGARVVPVEQRGYGSALRAGIGAAAAPYVFMADADGSYDFAEIPRFLERLREGCDLAMGDRFKGGIEPGAMPWKNRYIGNPILSGIGRLFFGSHLHDFHCGARAFRRDAIIALDLRTTGMEFASEMVIKAHHKHLRISEIPCRLRPDRRGRPPHLRPWRDGWRHLRFMLLFAPRWLFLFPGVFLGALGLLGMALLIPGPAAVGPVVFDIHSLLFSSIALLLGFQAVSFGALAESVAVDSGLRLPDRFLWSISRMFSLEVGVLLGLGLMVLGVVLGVASLWLWRSAGFGPVEPGQVMRWVIPSTTLLSLGVQVSLTSFLLGALNLPIRR